MVNKVIKEVVMDAGTNEEIHALTAIWSEETEDQDSMSRNKKVFAIIYSGYTWPVKYCKKFKYCDMILSQ